MIKAGILTERALGEMDEVTEVAAARATAASASATPTPTPAPASARFPSGGLPKHEVGYLTGWLASSFAGYHEASKWQKKLLARPGSPQSEDEPA